MKNERLTVKNIVTGIFFAGTLIFVFLIFEWSRSVRDAAMSGGATDIGSLIESQSSILIFSWLAIGAAMFFSLYWAVRSLIEQPVTMLSEMMDHIVTQGNLSRRVDLGAVGVSPNIRAFARDFNMLLDFIERRQQDINERDESIALSIEQMRTVAYYDSLTGLPNRLLLSDRLDRLIASAKRNNEHFSVLFMDLDRFKIINDTMGHSVGDKLLIAVAKRISDVIREEDTIARIGGDEFIIALRGADSNGAIKVANNIIEETRRAYLIDGQQVISKTSVGIAVYPGDGDSAETLIKNADIAMYQAKKDGRDNYRFYSDGMNFHSSNLFSIERALHVAIETGAFFLEFQPQLDIASGLPCGAEALIRWNHPQRGSVPPSDFITIAEETGQILQIGEWVLRESCMAAMEWRHNGFEIPVSVNVSARQFAHPDFISVVRGALDESGFPPDQLEIEITESVVADNIQSVITIMNTLRTMGIMLSVDDFGTGFSSLSYVRQMPITQLKIDRTFVGDIDMGDAVIAEHIISLGRRLKLDVIAEGVETSTQLCALRMMNCGKIQGFLYASPMRTELLLEFFKTHNPH